MTAFPAAGAGGPTTAFSAPFAGVLAVVPGAVPGVVVAPGAAVEPAVAPPSERAEATTEDGELPRGLSSAQLADKLKTDKRTQTISIQDIGSIQIRVNFRLEALHIGKPLGYYTNDDYRARRSMRCFR